MFSHSRRVEFSDTDAAGVVHFSRLLCFVEEAEHAWLRHLGLDPFPPGFGWPRTGLEVRYLAPARFPDVLQIDLFDWEARQSGLRYQFLIHHPDSSRDLCRGEFRIVHVAISPKGIFHPHPLPAQLANLTAAIG